MTGVQTCALPIFTGVNLGVALYTERVSSGTARKWTTAQATVNAASFTGVTDLTATVTTLSVEVNRAATDATVVDYATGKTSRSIKTGPSSTLDLTLKASDGALLRATGTLELDVFGFVQAEGTFGVEKRTNQQIVLGGGATVAVDELLIGGGSLTGFVGLNGGQANATGLSLTGVKIGRAHV